MSRFLSLLLLALVWIIVCVVVSGCIAPATPATVSPVQQDNASVRILSSPPGAEIYLDGVFRGFTPATFEDVPPGWHVIRLAMAGYTSWSGSLTVAGGQPQVIAAELITINEPMPVMSVIPAASPDAVPEIQVDGYWEYPLGRVTTENPVPLVVHIEAFNAGTITASDVTVSANFYCKGRMVCWSTVVLGTLGGGGHVSRDSLVSCSLPQPIPESGLDLKFENIVIKT